MHKNASYQMHKLLCLPFEGLVDFGEDFLDGKETWKVLKENNVEDN